jgi:uncharacterized protein (TIGR03083 family)
VEPRAYLDAIRREVHAMAGAVDAGRRRPVAACPGWDVAALTVHLGYVLRWVAEIVRTRASERITGEWTCGTDDPALAEWLVEGGDELCDALAGIDPDTPLWTMGAPRTARFWHRRQALETLVHRWDAEEAALATPGPVDPDLATDGIGEVVEMFAPRLHRRSGRTGTGETYHIHRTDGPGEWFMRFAPEGLEVTAEHAKADVALRGSAADLLLVLWRRLPPETVEVFGDAAVLARWFELVPAI